MRKLAPGAPTLHPAGAPGPSLPATPRGLADELSRRGLLTGGAPGERENGEEA